MKTRLISILALAASLLAVSCTSKMHNGGEEGTLTVGVSVNDATKAGSSTDELLSSASVSIYYADFSGLIRSYKYSEIPSAIYLPADNYRVDVLAGEAAQNNPAMASWDKKSYAGSKEFTIAPSSNTNVEVVAKVSNAVTKISFDPTIAENFSSYSLEIGVQDSKLVYDGTTSGKNGYFIIDGLVEPQFDWTFSGMLKKDGSTFSKTGSIEAIESGKTYELSFRYTIKDGDASFDLLVDYSTDIIDDTIVFEPVSTGLSASSIYEIWAAHATVHADVDAIEYPDPSKVKFAYSTDGSIWTTVDSDCTSEGVYQAVLTGLQPSTEYTYKLVIDGEDIGESMKFTTEAAPAVPNGSFEHYSYVKGAKYYKFYDPDCSDPASQTRWWASGNGEPGEVDKNGEEGISGSAAMGFVITDIDERTTGNHCVLAQSSQAFGMLTAGNIFTGNFSGIIGTSGGKVNFGRPWTARPTALRLWIKYTSGKMDVVNGSPEGVQLSTSVYDMCKVEVALGTWDNKIYGGTKNSPVLVNTTDASTFVDYHVDNSTIAFGELLLSADGKQTLNGETVSGIDNGQWRQVTIPLDYRKTNAYPTHVIISCAGNRYGDYFSGCSTAKLWVDEVEFLYE